MLRIGLAALALAAALAVAVTPSFAQNADYDQNNNGLIDVGTAAQLEVVRHDPDGDGTPIVGDGTTAYQAVGAYPVTSEANQGCPSTCTGYELTADIALSGSWTPIPNYNAVFDGAQFAVSGLAVEVAGNAGLFAEIGSAGVVRNLSLTNVDVKTTGAFNAGALAGRNQGAVRSVAATGLVESAGGHAGGLVGRNQATISTSYALINVKNTGTSASSRAGGLAGSNIGSAARILASYAAGAVSGANGAIGGLVGENSGTIQNAYAAVNARRTGASGDVGGLRGRATSGTVTNSYWDSELYFSSPMGAGSGANGTGQTRDALTTTNGYTGIYASWSDDNVDGQAGDDAPWFFYAVGGAALDRYPVLRLGYTTDARLEAQSTAQRTWFTHASGADPISATYKDGVNTTSLTRDTLGYATSTVAFRATNVHGGGNYLDFAGKSAYLTGDATADNLPDRANAGVLSASDADATKPGVQVSAAPEGSATDDRTAYVLIGHASGGEAVGFLRRYRIRVQAENRAPLKILELSPVAGSGTVTLSWRDPEDSTINKYHICRTASASTTAPSLPCTSWSEDTTSTVGWTVDAGDVTDNGATLSIIDSGGSGNRALSGQQYWYYVRAWFDGATDLFGPASDGAAVTAVAGSPPMFVDTGPANPTYLYLVDDSVNLQLPRVRGGDGAPSYKIAVEDSTTGTANTLTIGTGTTQTIGATGLSFNTTTGAITGTVNPLISTHTQPYNVTVTVDDADANMETTDQDTWAFDIEFEADATPTFGTTPIDGATGDGTLTYLESVALTTDIDVPATVGLTGGDNTPLTYSAAGLPAGLTMSSAGVISGTPAAVIADANFNVTVTVTDGDATYSTDKTSSPDSDTTTFTIAIWDDKEPAIADPGDFSFLEQTTITNISISASGGNGTLTYSDNSTLPAGLSINSSTGVISGTLTTDRTANTDTEAIITVTDGDAGADNESDADTAMASFTIRELVNTTPNVTDPSDIAFTVGEDVSVPAPAVNGGDGPPVLPANLPLTFTVSGLPSGLSIDSATGAISGTATAAMVTGSPHTVTITATDDDSQTGTGSFALTINADTAPTIATINDVRLTKGTASSISALPVATGGNGAIEYAVTTDLSASNFAGGTLPPGEVAGALPLGLSFNPSPTSRVISGTPANAFSNITVTYTATDADGDAASQTFDMNSREIVILPGEALTAAREQESSYSVKLGSQPSGSVSVTIWMVGSEPGAFRIGTTSEGGPPASGYQALAITPTPTLTFTATNWNTPQTVYIYGRNQNSVSSGFTLQHRAYGANYGGSTATSPGLIKDVAVTGFNTNADRLVFNPSDVTIPEGGFAAVELSLAVNPSADVTVTFTDVPSPLYDAPSVNSANALTNGAVDVTTNFEHTFRPDGAAVGAGQTHWASSTTIYIAAGEDNNADNEDSFTRVTVTSADTGYSGLTAAQRTLNYLFIDNDARGVTAALPASGAFIEGTPTAYTVVLDSQPVTTSTGTARIQVTPTAPGMRFGVSTSSGDVSGNAYVTFGNSSTAWSTPLTIYAIAEDDDDMEDISNVVITHTIAVQGSIADAGYDGATFTAAVNITDDDAPGVTVDGDLATAMNQSTATVPEGGTSQFSVALARTPADDVTVVLSFDSGAGAGDLRFVPDNTNAPQTKTTTHSLAFTPANWSAPQTVTLYAGADDDADSDAARLRVRFTGSADPDYAAAPALTGDPGATPTPPNPSPLEITVTDPNMKGVAVSPASLTLTEGEVGYYTIRLTSRPAGAVTVNNQGDGSMSFTPHPVFFSPSNWDTPQRVTVTALENDHVFQGGARTISHSASAPYGATDYTGASVALTITDNDVAGAAFNVESLAIDEGGKASYTIRLAARPATGATIRVTPTATGFTFNTADDGSGVAYIDFSRDGDMTTTPPISAWNVPVEMFATAPSDGDDEDEVGVGANGISHAFAVQAGTDASYAAASATTLAYTIADDDEVGVVATTTGGTRIIAGSAVEGFEIVENGEGTYQIQLGTDPASTASTGIRVTPRVSESSTASSVTFNTMSDGTGNAYFDFTSAGAPQTVYVDLGDDVNSASGETFTILHRTSLVDSTETDADYSHIVDYAPVVGTTIDDDTPNAVIAADVNANGRLEIAEGGTNTFTVRLITAPTNDVTVSLSLTGAAAADAAIQTSAPADPLDTAATHALTFTSSNYGMAQTVILHANADGDSTNEIGAVRLAFSDSVDTGYKALAAKSLSIELADDDENSIVFRRNPGDMADISSLSFNEGSSETYYVALSTPPDANVRVDLTALDYASLNVRPTTLTFTPANWSSPQSVTVRAPRDSNGDNENARILHEASANYGAESTLAVEVIDLDSPGINLSALSIAVDEAPTSGNTYTVRLNTQPDASVTVNLVGSGVTVSPTSLTFTSASSGAQSWRTARTITIDAAADPDAADGTASVAHNAVSTGSYSGLTAALSVTVRDRPVASQMTVASSVATDGGDTYTRGERIEIDVTFDRDVIVTGTPSLPIRIGNATKQAAYVDPDAEADPYAETTVKFAYAVQRLDADTDGITVAQNAVLSGGAIKETDADAMAQSRANAPRNASRALPDDLVSYADQGDHKVDGSRLLTPVFQGYDTPAVPLGYHEIITVDLDFNIPVDVVAASDDSLPTVAIQIDANTRQAECAAGEGLNPVVCSYQIQHTDVDANGISIAAAAGASAIALNGATIRHPDPDGDAADLSPSELPANALADAPNNNDRPINGESSNIGYNNPNPDARNLPDLYVRLRGTVEVAGVESDSSFDLSPLLTLVHPDGVTTGFDANVDNYRGVVDDALIATLADIDDSTSPAVRVLSYAVPWQRPGTGGSSTADDIRVGENRVVIASTGSSLTGAGANPQTRFYYVTILREGPTNADVRELEMATEADGPNLLDPLNRETDALTSRLYSAPYSSTVPAWPRAQQSLALKIRLSDPAARPSGVAPVRLYRYNIEGRVRDHVLRIPAAGTPSIPVTRDAPADPGDPVYYRANLDLRAGNNYFLVVITARDGTTRNTYLVHALRGGDPIFLDGLRVTGGVLVKKGGRGGGFDSEHLEYTVSALNNVRSVRVTATSNEEGASISINGRAGATRDVPVSVGANTIRVTISKGAQGDDDYKDPTTYVITVTRGRGPAPTGAPGPGPIIVATPTPTPIPTPTPVATPTPPCPAPAPGVPAPARLPNGLCPTPIPTPPPSPAPCPTPGDGSPAPTRTPSGLCPAPTPAPCPAPSDGSPAATRTPDGLCPTPMPQPTAPPTTPPTTPPPPQPTAPPTTPPTIPPPTYVATATPKPAPTPTPAPPPTAPPTAPATAPATMPPPAPGATMTPPPAPTAAPPPAPTGGVGVLWIAVGLGAALIIVGGGSVLVLRRR